jgi:hypothetical protein
MILYFSAMYPLQENKKETTAIVRILIPEDFRILIPSFKH